MLNPCNHLGDKEATIDPECITDPEKQYEYLGVTSSFEILYNSERIDLDKYGEESIVKSS